MSDDATGKPIPISQRDTTRSAAPIIGAAVLTVLVVLGIVLFGVLKPAGKNVTTADRVDIAVRNFARAEGASEGDRAANTCGGFDPARSPLGPGAVGKQVDVVSVTGITVAGDRATATVTSRIDGHERTSTWNLTRTNSFWRVCDS
jgi:hypothetical protein